ncbi:MAG: hypothetical protein WAX23_12315 [Methanosarcina sp.]
MQKPARKENCKQSKTVTWSPYIEQKITEYVEDKKLFSSASDMASIAMTQLISRLEAKV